MPDTVYSYKSAKFLSKIPFFSFESDLWPQNVNNWFKIYHTLVTINTLLWYQELTLISILQLIKKGNFTYIDLDLFDLDEGQRSRDSTLVMSQRPLYNIVKRSNWYPFIFFNFGRKCEINGYDLCDLENAPIDLQWP